MNEQPFQGHEDLSETAWPFNSDSPHVAEILASGRRVEILLIDVVGLTWPEIEVHLDAALDAAREKMLVPVFLTDATDFSGFRSRRLIYDALPNAAAAVRLSPDLDWPAYVERRRQIAIDVWRPTAIVPLSGLAQGST